MAEVNVTRAAVKKAQNSCNVAKEELMKAKSNLCNQLQTASAGWRDSKFREFQMIVNKCVEALTQPIGQLNACDQSLSAIDAALAAYENA